MTRKTPFELRLLKGNPGKRPLSPPLRAPAPDEPLPPPTFLDNLAREEWLRLAPHLHRMKMLSVLDVAAFSAYCQAYSRWRAAEAAIERALAQGEALAVRGSTQNQIPHPLIRIAKDAAAAMARYGREFGLSPSG